ncbi:MAG: glycosyltransferase family 2 protein [Xanthomonadales bacterium]|nr:glycosyltransferase family 2 protein [Xanthomonadales bacterium]
MAALVRPQLMLVEAVVVNFNSGQAVQSCVASLFGSTVVPRVKVIDNASDDRSAEQLRQLYGSHPGIEFLFNARNEGFAAAVNQGIRDSESPFTLIINPDCRVESAALESLLAVMDQHPRAALAGPRVLDSKGRTERASLRRLPSPWRSLMTVTGLSRLERWFPGMAGVVVPHHRWPDDPAVVEAVSGACMLIRRAALEEVGLLDEDYGLHCEDLDLMQRLRDHGWEIMIVPAAKAHHEQGVSSRSRPFWVHRQKHMGMARYFRKFQAERYPWPVRALVLTGIWMRYLLLLPLVFIRK